MNKLREITSVVSPKLLPYVTVINGKNYLPWYFMAYSLLRNSKVFNPNWFNLNDVIHVHKLLLTATKVQLDNCYKLLDSNLCLLILDLKDRNSLGNDFDEFLENLIFVQG